MTILSTIFCHEMLMVCFCDNIFPLNEIQIHGHNPQQHGGLGNFLLRLSFPTDVTSFPWAWNHWFTCFLIWWWLSHGHTFLEFRNRIIDLTSQVTMFSIFSNISNTHWNNKTSHRQLRLVDPVCGYSSAAHGANWYYFLDTPHMWFYQLCT